MAQFYCDQNEMTHFQLNVQSKMYAKNPYVSSKSAVFSLGSPMVDIGLSTEEKCEPTEGTGVIYVTLPVVAPVTEIEVSMNDRYL